MNSFNAVRILAVLFFIGCLPTFSHAQASCAAAFDLTSANCHTGNLQDAVASSPSGSCAGTTGLTAYGVWYRFTASGTTATLSVSSTGSSIVTSATYLQAFNGADCNNLTALNCTPITSSLNLASLTPGNTYLVRLYVTSPPTSSPANRRGFTITLQQTPANDLCTNATLLTSATTCTNTAATLSGATASSPAVTSTCAGTPGGDEWFQFVASATNATVTISSVGSALSAAGTYIQLLSGACGTLSTLACVNGTTVTGTSLTVGGTYYVRVYSTTALPTGCNWSFNICVTHVPPPANDECSAATTLTSNTSCVNTSGTLLGATASSPAVASSCAGTPGADVWYRFTAQATNATVTVSSNGSSFPAAGTYIQIVSGACGSVTNVSCVNSTSIAATNLTIGTTYLVRVYSTSTATTTGTWTFNLCVTHVPAPSNDLCTGATSLTSRTSCTNTAGTLAGANTSSPAVASTCAGTPGADVWYTFVAQTTHASIALSSIGSSLSTAGASIQLFSGSCGSLTSIACVSGNASSLSLNTANIAGATLRSGTTYFVRIYTPSSNTTSGTWTFNLCITDVTARIEYSRSYINVTKGTTGGTVDVGDTLEMRVTLVISSKVLDSLSFTDTLFNAKGLRLVPGSIALRTNEGKIYGNTIGSTPSAFTDALDADAGWHYASGLDTVIRINFGTGASSTRRGQLSNTSRPSVFNNTCIIMATYRAVVYAPYDTKINFKTGALTYRDQAIDAAGTVNTVTFNTNHLVVYRSPGLCPNAVSATNTLGAEFDGTFGAPTGSAPLARNRGTTPFTTYLYTPFSSTGGPQDYYYAIANNTSQQFTTINTWNKPDANGYRLFTQWDITGDHTGASNAAQGNPACDTTLPRSTSNPCGYMLVINSSYKTDTAFTYTVSNLCPNTYYEISAWFKNICYKCGCDSTGTGSGTSGYIPTALGDSSGVRPNIAFDVNGADYYTTGDIYYLGTTPTGSDANNRWVKRGFTYLTGPSETSFTLTLRNNAPGGGGNDWALDDISVATCLPNMTYSPTITPTTCRNNPITIYDTVRTYFNNYQHFKWQRSINNGVTWTDIAGHSGTAAPQWNGTEWQYVLPYNIAPEYTTLSNNGDKYRVAVATTTSNLANADCLFSDGISIVTLEVDDCTILPQKLLSFNGKLQESHAVLNWSVASRSGSAHYIIERSADGNSFKTIGTVPGKNTTAAGTQAYTFTDSTALSGKAWYRIILVDAENNRQFSNSILLESAATDFMVTGVVNPFSSRLNFNLTVARTAATEVTLASLSGSIIKRQVFTASKGVNAFTLNDLYGLPSGVYLLEVRYMDRKFLTKVIKNK